MQNLSLFAFRIIYSNFQQYFATFYLTKLSENNQKVDVENRDFNLRSAAQKQQTVSFTLWVISSILSFFIYSFTYMLD